MKMIFVNLIIFICAFQCTIISTSTFHNNTSNNILKISKIIHSIIGSFADSQSSSTIYFIRKAESISTYRHQSDILDESLKQISSFRSVISTSIISIEERNVICSYKKPKFYNVILIDDYNSFR